MRTRFNYFVRIESAPVGGKLIFGGGKALSRSGDRGRGDVVDLWQPKTQELNT